MSAQTKIEINVTKEFEEELIHSSLSVNSSQIFVSNHKINEFSFKKIFTDAINNESLLETLEDNFKLAQGKDNKRNDSKTTVTWDGEAIENQVAQLELNIFKRKGSKYVEAQVYVGGKLMQPISHQDSIVTETSGIFKNISNTKDIIDLVNKIVLSPENNERLWKLNNPPHKISAATSEEIQIGTIKPLHSNEQTEQLAVRVGGLVTKNDDGSKDRAFHNKVKETIDKKIDSKVIGAVLGEIGGQAINKNPHSKYITAHEFLKNNLTQEGYNKLRAEGILAHIDETELVFGLNNDEKNLKEAQKRISGPVDSINTQAFGMKDCRTKLQRKQNDLENELKQLQSECESLQFQTLSDFEKSDIIEAINITQQAIVINLRRINRETK